MTLNWKRLIRYVCIFSHIFHVPSLSRPFTLDRRAYTRTQPIPTNHYTNRQQCGAACVTICCVLCSTVCIWLVDISKRSENSIRCCCWPKRLKMSASERVHDICHWRTKYYQVWTNVAVLDSISDHRKINAKLKRVMTGTHTRSTRSLLRIFSPFITLSPAHSYD